MMLSRIWNIVWSIVVICLFPYTVDSQRIIINSQGEAIVMYPDGSWRKAEAGDSLLMRQHAKSSSTVSSGGDSNLSATERNQAEEQEYLLYQWNELYIQIRAEEKKVQNEFRAATNVQFKAAERLHNAEANKDLLGPEKLKTLKNDYDQSVHLLRKAKLQQKDIKSIFDKSKKINLNLASVTKQKFSKIRSKYMVYLHSYDPGREIIITPAAEVPLKNTSSPPSRSATASTAMAPVSVAPFDPSMRDKLPSHRKARPYFSEPYECMATIDSIDSITKTRKIILRPDLIFTHTDPDLRPFFKDKDLITCKGYLYSIGPYVYLTLDFQIASSHSQSNFGSLQNGSLLRLKMMNGEYITLYNLKSDNGRIDPYSGFTLFSSQYGLGKTELKKLGASGLDQMRVLWGTGYEDYEVQHLDFLVNQIECLKTKKKN